MSKRVQFALSLPQLSAAAPQESARAVLYAKAAGLFVRQPDGTEVGPLAAQGAQAAGADAKEVTVDFGATPTRSATLTVTDAAVTPSSQILLTQSGRGAAGRADDENELDPLLARAVPGAGSMTVFVTAQDGPVVGAYLLNYLVA